MKQKHHIMLASEQLWPNLLGMAALKERDGGVASLHILHTGDPVRSGKPAKQLARLAAKILPGVPCRMHLTGVTSQEVLDVLHRLMRGHAETLQWAINATGGTKTMFAGLLPWIRRENVEAFYREVTGSWFHLSPLEREGLQGVFCDEWDGPKRARVSLPVWELATVQSDHPESAKWDRSEPPGTTPAEMTALTGAGRACGWNWSTLQKSYPMLGKERGGFAFEHYFAALVKLCGAHSVAMNLKMKHDGRICQELDVIVSTGTKLVLFDLKLSEVEGDAVIDQISRLGEDKRSLGGLNAAAVAVRPSWRNNATTTAIARSHGVEVWSQEKMGDLVPHILRLLEERPDKIECLGLSPLHHVLQSAKAAEEPLFTHSRHLPKTREGLEMRLGWLNFGPYWTECLNEGKCAVVIVLGGQYDVRVLKSTPGWQDEQTLKRTLPNGSKIKFFERSKSPGTTATAILSATQEGGPLLKDYLLRLVANSSAATSPPSSAISPQKPKPATFGVPLSDIPGCPPG
ncbi:MAG: hypothetical protein IAE94_14735 [Chthoniobacterales bacterium]|nr:hypothetical protein [Chthoniobacterales bacterium]